MHYSVQYSKNLLNMENESNLEQQTQGVTK